VAYVKDRCRCPACTAANSAASRNRRRRALFGHQSSSTLVDATPVREHIAQLRAAGLGYDRLSRLAGTSARHLRDIACTTPTPTHKAPIRRIRTQLAEALLTIDPATATYLRDARGTRRRLTALVALGWPLPHIAALLGRRPDSLARTLTANQVTAATAAATAKLYDDLAEEPPSHTPTTLAAKRYAQDRGWVPPLAWDDIDTDAAPHDAVADPTTDTDQQYLDEIAIEAATAGRLSWRQLTDAEAAEAVRRLAAHGRSTRSIANQLRASRTVIRHYITESVAS
jgi:hypothetical protein